MRGYIGKKRRGTDGWEGRGIREDRLG